MAKRVVLVFPNDDACPICGRQLIILKWTPSYKEAICERGKGHCGWWGYEERGSFRNK